MPRRPAAVTQADIARALRAAMAAGDDWRVEIAPGGVITIVRGPAAARLPGVGPPVAPKREWVL